MLIYACKCKMDTAQIEFWKAQEHARVLSGLNPLTTTAINGSAKGKKHFGHGQ